MSSFEREIQDALFAGTLRRISPERVREQPAVAPVRLLKQFHTSVILLRE